MPDLGLEIVVIGLGTDLDFLDLHHSLAFLGLLLLFLRLVLELAVVHNLADGRRGLRSNLHKVHIFLDSHVLRGCQRHDTELLALRTDQADLLVSDLLVQFMHYFTNGRSTSISESQNADTMQASAQQQTALLAVCEQRCKPLCPLA